MWCYCCLYCTSLFEIFCPIVFNIYLRTTRGNANKTHCIGTIMHYAHSWNISIRFIINKHLKCFFHLFLLFLPACSISYYKRSGSAEPMQYKPIAYVINQCKQWKDKLLTIAHTHNSVAGINVCKRITSSNHARAYIPCTSSTGKETTKYDWNKRKWQS